MKTCKYCGKEVSDTAKKCMHCGKWLNEENNQTTTNKNTKSCPYCGKEIFATARKCKHCGSWLTADQKKKNNETKGTLSQNSDNKNINMFLKIALYGFLIITIIISLNNIISVNKKISLVQKQNIAETKKKESNQIEKNSQNKDSENKLKQKEEPAQQRNEKKENSEEAKSKTQQLVSSLVTYENKLQELQNEYTKKSSLLEKRASLGVNVDSERKNVDLLKYKAEEISNVIYGTYGNKNYFREYRCCDNNNISIHSLYQMQDKFNNAQKAFNEGTITKQEYDEIINNFKKEITFLLYIYKNILSLTEIRNNYFYRYSCCNNEIDNLYNKVKSGQDKK